LLKDSHFYRAMLLHCGSMMSVCLSVCLSDETLVDCDHTSWATWNFITRLISPLSRLVARKISAI